MSITIHEWLQDALIDFLRDWVRERVVPERHPEAKDMYVETECRDASPSAVKIYWRFGPWEDRVSGEEWFTPRDALALFLQHGTTDGVKP